MMDVLLLFFNSTADSTWDGTWTFCDVYTQSSETLQNGTFTYEQGETDEHPDRCLTTSLANWNVKPDTNVLTQGDFVHSGSTFYLYGSTVEWINTGNFEVLSSWTLYNNPDYNAAPDDSASFFNVGILKLLYGITSYVNIGDCNDGLLLLSDDSATTFSHSGISAQKRFSFQGGIALEVSPEFDQKDYSFSVTVLTYNSDVYPDDFDSTGTPKTLKIHKDYDVIQLDEDGDEYDDYDEVNVCFSDFSDALYVYYKGFPTTSCKKQPSDVEEGICERDVGSEFPESTTDIPGADGSATTIVFSMVSMFSLIAALFILS